MKDTFTGRLPKLDFLRAFSAGVVIAYHYGFEAVPAGFGVLTFFVISGFLITFLLLKENERTGTVSLKDFYIRRSLRIFPAFYVYWLLVVGTILVVKPSRLPVTQAICSFFYVANYYQGLHGYPSTLLSHTWSLGVEEQFYLLWPLAVFWLNRKQLIYCASGMLVVAPVLRWVCTPLFHDHFAIYMLLPFRMDTLAAGALIALIWPELEQRLAHTGGERLRRTIAGVGAVAAVAALFALEALSRHGDITGANTKLGNTGIYEAVLVIVTAAFLAVLLGFGKKLLSTWAFQWIGRISYSVYLIHLTALYLAPNHNVLIAMVMTVVYSLAMWFLVENPINNLGHRPAKVLVTQ